MSGRLYSKANVFAIGAFLCFSVGAVMTTIVPVLVEKSLTAKRQAGVEMTALSDAEARGRAVYVREGCWYCHTQQVRTLPADEKRFGWRGIDAKFSVPGEYVNDNPHLLGTRRIGPDLARVGGKYHNDWHRAHFIAPREVTKGSVMPDFPWLFEAGTTDGQDLIAYIQSLGRSRHWRDKEETDYEAALPDMPQPPKPAQPAVTTKPVTADDQAAGPESSNASAPDGGDGL